MGSRRCNLHGGKTPKGPGSPHYTTGRHSQWVPDYYAEAVKLSADETVVDIQQQIALWDIRLGELLRQLPDGGGRASWLVACNAFRDFQVANNAGRLSAMKLALEQLETVLEAGRHESNIWHEAVVETRAKLTDRELRRQVGLFSMIPGKEALGMMQALIEVVKRHVDDPTTLAAISAEYLAIVGFQGRGRVPD